MKTVFTNGCFDIIHRGHLELLRFCRTLGTKVIVGINSDNSVKRLKGISRPIISQDDRKALLEELRCVDQVIIFDEDTPYELIQLVKPDIIVKGSDYSTNQVVGNDIAKVVIFNLLDGYSSTKTIQSISSR